MSVIVNGRECISLSITLLHSDIAKALRLKLTTSKLKATSDISESLQILSEATVNLVLGSQSFVQRVYVSSNITQEVILSTDFLKR